MPDILDSAQTSIADQKRAALAALAEGGQAGLAAWKQASASVAEQGTSALDAALKEAQGRGDQSAADYTRAVLGTPSVNAQASIAQRQASSADTTARMRQATGAYFDELGASTGQIRADADAKIAAAQAAAAAARRGGGGGGGGGGSANPFKLSAKDLFKGSVESIRQAMADETSKQVGALETQRAKNLVTSRYGPGFADTSIEDKRMLRKMGEGGGRTELDALHQQQNQNDALVKQLVDLATGKTPPPAPVTATPGDFALYSEQHQRALEDQALLASLGGRGGLFDPLAHMAPMTLNPANQVQPVSPGAPFSVVPHGIPSMIAAAPAFVTAQNNQAARGRAQQAVEQQQMLVDQLRMGSTTPLPGQMEQLRVAEAKLVELQNVLAGMPGVMPAVPLGPSGRVGLPDTREPDQGVLAAELAQIGTQRQRADQEAQQRQAIMAQFLGTPTTPGMVDTAQQAGEAATRAGSLLGRNEQERQIAGQYLAGMGLGPDEVRAYLEVMYPAPSAKDLMDEAKRANDELVAATTHRNLIATGYATPQAAALAKQGEVNLATTPFDRKVGPLVGIDATKLPALRQTPEYQQAAQAAQVLDQMANQGRLDLGTTAAGTPMPLSFQKLRQLLYTQHPELPAQALDLVAQEYRARLEGNQGSANLTAEQLAALADAAINGG